MSNTLFLKKFVKRLNNQNNIRIYNFSENSLKNILSENLKTFTCQNEIRSLKYMWNLGMNKTMLENNIHNYYTKLLQLLCDKSISFNSISDNFSDDINNFINERNTHPGIPYFHFFRFQNNLFNYDFALSNINIKLTNVSLLCDYSNQVQINTNNNNNDINQVLTIILHFSLLSIVLHLVFYKMIDLMNIQKILLTYFFWFKPIVLHFIKKKM